MSNDLADCLLSYLDSAYNLARWLVGNGAEAEDVVQDAYLRAFQHSGTFRGGDPRAWLLTIVRNASYNWLRKKRACVPVAQFDEEIHIDAVVRTRDPEELLLLHADARDLEQALQELPVRSREILVLRELEELSYKEISEVMGIPIGTVMSTLSRARRQFRERFISRSDRFVASRRKEFITPRLRA